jgi:hypothetical protein
MEKLMTPVARSFREFFPAKKQLNTAIKKKLDSQMPILGAVLNGSNKSTIYIVNYICTKTNVRAFH